MSKGRRITKARSYTVNGTKVWHQFSDTENGLFHRLAVNGIAADWWSYHNIASFQLGRRSFAATTEYYVDTLPSVFEIIKGVADV